MARILLAEDEFLIRLLLMEELIEHGHDVVGAGSAEEALQQAEGTRCDVLVTDIHMGGKIDGIELARRLRVNNPGLPIIFITGRPGALTVAGKLGPHDVLVRKPFTTSDIMSALNNIIVLMQ